MTPPVAIFLAVATLVGIVVFFYLTVLAIDFWAVKRWLDDHERQLRDGEENK